jgi:type I site-specific restriction-modification system R (restriction) subunit
VQVQFRNDKGELVKRRLRVFDFNEPTNNHFLAVRELWVRGALYRRRADLMGFVNGIPLLFEELLKFVASLDRESTRALREGLDEETLALFDLLLKPDLSKKEIERLKQVATELLAKLKAEKLRADNWWEKQATRDAVKVEIHDFLWNEETGLPVECYSDQEVDAKVEQVYLHIFNVYTSPSSSAFVHLCSIPWSHRPGVVHAGLARPDERRGTPWT